MSAGLAVFDTTLQETNAFLNLVEARLHPCDHQQAYAATRAVLQELRDRLPVDIALGLSAQLPMLMRGFFLEGWRPEQTPSDIRDFQTFAQAVAARLPPHFPREATASAEAVFGVLSGRITPGMTAKIGQTLPESLRSVWLRSAMPGPAVREMP